jgi:hypothetical protein
LGTSPLSLTTNSIPLQLNLSFIEKKFGPTYKKEVLKF